MSQLQERIAQFRKMATDDPDNELGHYRLGQLLMDDKQYDEAIKSLRRTLELSPEFSKVYQLLGQCLMDSSKHLQALKAFPTTFPTVDPKMPPSIMADYAAEHGREDLAGALRHRDQQYNEAITTLKQGFEVADQRGDKMPRDEMGRMLVTLGETAPEAKREARPLRAAGTGSGFQCQRPMCVAAGHAHQLEAPPMKDEDGQRIFQTICADCWNDWKRNYSIKVINELRLDLSTDRGAAEYDRYMREFLGLE